MLNLDRVVVISGSGTCSAEQVPEPDITTTRSKLSIGISVFELTSNPGAVLANSEGDKALPVIGFTVGYLSLN